MAIGTMTAIGLGLGAVGAVAGASSANRASRRAAQTAQDNTAANNALARDIYGQNQQLLNPFVQRGNAAGNQINALLGLGGTAQPAQAPVQPNALSQFQGGTMPAGYGYGLGDGGAMPYDRDTFPMTGSNRMAWQSQLNQGQLAYPAFGNQVVPQNNTATTGTVPAGQTPQQAANSAFDIFKSSTGYQSRLDEGMNALNSGYAGAGVLQSGAAVRDAIRFGQDFASNEFGNYMGYLGNQQGVGLAAGSAVAGVGQNYVNNVTANNNAGASAVANSQLYRGANNPFANALGMVGGGLFGYGR